MPELPDVEVFKQYVHATCLHKKITDVDVRSQEILDDVSSRKLKRELMGGSFERASRHGKQLFVSIAGGDWLSMHFGMTGGLRYFKGMAKDTPYERLLVSFSNGYLLAYDCQRKFGKIGLVRDPEAYLNDHDLGPDALDDDFDFKAFRQALRGRRATVKSALMNQQCIAGIGNVYSDEILFQAKIRPDTRTGALDADHLRRIYRTLRRALRTAVDRRADPDQMPKSWLTPRRRRGGACPRCGGDIRRAQVSGRTAYYCATHQR
jgi:formamidopyrimidine-DNA glycosylase